MNHFGGMNQSNTTNACIHINNSIKGNNKYQDSRKGQNCLKNCQLRHFHLTSEEQVHQHICTAQNATPIQMEFVLPWRLWWICSMKSFKTSWFLRDSFEMIGARGVFLAFFFLDVDHPSSKFLAMKMTIVSCIENQAALHTDHMPYTSSTYFVSRVRE